MDRKPLDLETVLRRWDFPSLQRIINNTIKQKRSKAIDVHFDWLRDRVQQGHFHIFWDSGKNNLADFYTKHHPPSYHKRNRPIQSYVEGLSPESLQGCIEMMNGGQMEAKTPTLNAGYPQQETQVVYLTVG